MLVWWDVFALRYTDWKHISRELLTRNSSGDEIANVNFLYDDIVHVLYCVLD